MQIIRTIVWIAITAALVAFVAMNWEPAPVNFWPLENGAYLHLQWPVGVIAIFFFAAGALPMWLLSKAGRWRMSRRLMALENAMRAGLPTSVLAGEAELSHGGHASITPDGELREAPKGTYPGDLREN
jgi:uncharacterized integral membrane protein